MHTLHTSDGRTMIPSSGMAGPVLMTVGFVLAPAIGYEITSHLARRADRRGEPRSVEAGVVPLVDLRE